MSMTEEQLQAIEERAAKATPGPWRFSGQDGVPGHCITAQVWRPGGRSLLSLEPTDDQEATATAALIAHARADVPALCAEVRRLRSELQATEELFARLAHDSDACRLGAESERAAILADIMDIVASPGDRASLARALRERGDSATLPPDRLLARSYCLEAALREIVRAGGEQAVAVLQQIARTALAEAAQ